jgi:hypothetical protein
MLRLLAALVFVMAALNGLVPGFAQDASQPSPTDETHLKTIIETELSPETKTLADQLVQLSGTGRAFDELLPSIAQQAKNGFIKANPQMQLGIIEVVDRVAITLVSRRPELDDYLARVWASGFTNEEMQELIDFYSSDTGKKFSDVFPEVLAVQTAAAQEWGKSVSAELTRKVVAELRAAVAAEQKALQSDVAGPATGEAQPQQ